jgi:hypothetical protein
LEFLLGAGQRADREQSPFGHERLAQVASEIELGANSILGRGVIAA